MRALFTHEPRHQSTTDFDTARGFGRMSGRHQRAPVGGGTHNMTFVVTPSPSTTTDVWWQCQRATTHDKQDT